MMKRLTALLLAALLLMILACAQADPNLTLQDSAQRHGPWPAAYLRILKDRSAGIQAYQDYVQTTADQPVCRPVGLTDLTGDGLPELLFLDLVHDFEYGFTLGRLWIYTADETGVRCVLTLEPEIDDLLYSACYLGPDGLLTLQLNDTEVYWTLQLRPDSAGRYAPETVLAEYPDFSGLVPDQYFLNGTELTEDRYRRTLDQIRSSRGTVIGSLLLEDENCPCGFSLTLQEAAQLLSSEEELSLFLARNGADTASLTPPAPAGRFPELSFSPVTFAPGQKFAVYSAPSTRSWRGAGGKAAITSGSEIFAAGLSDGWILILYELNSGVTRVGYMDAGKIGGSVPSLDPLVLSGTDMTLVESAVLTDDPAHQKSTVGKLKKGASVTCLAEYQGWIYVEAKVSGKTARGFIAPSALGLD